MRQWETTQRLDSSDSNVSKFIFYKSDAVAEAVLYKYNSYEARTVICCSTQSGCPIGCRFCGSGDNFVRSLTYEEIAEQVTEIMGSLNILAADIAKFQIMFMSMGEPALNQKHLVWAIEDLNRLYPNAQLLVSTSAPRVDFARILGAASRIDKIGLQFSVHESTDEARDRLIPFKDKMTLAEIARTGEAFYRRSGRTPFFNYCAHSGNTSDEDVVRLLSLFNPNIWQATVSVICERDEHVASANERQQELAAGFMSKLLAVGYSVRLFNPAGQDDIGGGCGQLWFVQDWMNRHPDLARPSAGYRLPVAHTPRCR